MEESSSRKVIGTEDMREDGMDERGSVRKRMGTKRGLDKSQKDKCCGRKMNRNMV